jgi:hypothetical protein
MTVPPHSTRNKVALYDGFLALTWLDETVTEENAREAMSRITELSAGGIYPLLVELRGIQKVTYRAQKTFAAGPWAVSHVAIVPHSSVDRVAANLYLGRYPAATPVRVFDSANQAFGWLLDPAGPGGARYRSANRRKVTCNPLTHWLPACRVTSREFRCRD